MDKAYLASIYAHAFGGYYAPVNEIVPTDKWVRLEALDHNGNVLSAEVHSIRQIAPITSLASKSFATNLHVNVVFREVEFIHLDYIGEMGCFVGRANVIRKGIQLSPEQCSQLATVPPRGCLAILTAGLALIAIITKTVASLT